MATQASASIGLQSPAEQTPQERLLLDLVDKQPLLVGMNLLLAGLLAGALVGAVSFPMLIGWFSFLVVTQAARFGFWWVCRRTPPDAKRAGLGLTIASLLAGIAWGLAGLLLAVPGSTVHLMLVSFVIGGMTAGAMTTLPSHPPTYYAFILPALLPYAIRLGLEDEPIAQLMGLMVLTYLGGIALVGYHVYQSLRRAIEVHLESARLVADLEAKGRALERQVEQSSIQLATILETVPASLWIVHDAEARRITGSRYATDRLRLDHDRNQPMTAAELERPQHYQILYNDEPIPPEEMPLQRASRGDVVENQELRIRFEDGSHYDEVVSAVPLRDGDGNVTGAVGAGIDITRRRRVEEALRLSEQRFRDFATSASDWLWETDETHRFTWFSPNVEDLMGIRREWHYGKTRWEIMAPSVDPEIVEAHRRVLEAHQPFRDLEYVRRGPNGDEWMSASGVPVFDPNGRFKGYRGVGRDITSRKSVEKEIAYLAHHDSLTKLANRHTLQIRLAQALGLAARHGRLGALLLFDLDYFKEVNDAHGHMAGDQLLRLVAARLKPAIRDSDTFARFGGDEFAIVVPDVRSREGAAELAQRLITLLAEPFAIGDKDLEIAASIGVALFPDGINAPHQLIQRADRALYRAKRDSRGQFRMYEAELDAQVQWRKQLSSEIRRALEQGELELHFQPQLEFASHRLIGTEALVRWRHPERGLLGPDEFIPIAEAAGLSRALDRWVLQAACAQSRLWRERGQPIRIAVNLSQALLSHADMLPTIEEIMIEAGVTTDWIELELTESFVMERFSETTDRNLRGLADRGILLSLDDFGKGYSSLASLRTLPVSKIKIDRSFIGGIGRIEQDEALVRLIVNLGHTLDKRVLAEGIETDHQLAFLDQLGCDEAQGFLIGRPVPAHEIALDSNWLAAS